jgi:acyl-CoA thioesterase-1
MEKELAGLSRTYGVEGVVRKHIRVMLAALMLALWSVAVRAEPYQIVGFGDSLMAGYGLQPGESFAEKLEKALKVKGHDVVVANAGVSGDTTSGGLSRLDWSVPANTKLVILELGANDMLRGVSPALTEANLDKMLSALKAKQAKVLLAGMRAAPNLGPDYQRQFDAIYPKLAEKYGVALYPFFLDGVAADKAYLLDDGMHPNAAGIDRMVERVLPVVERLMAAGPA